MKFTENIWKNKSTPTKKSAHPTTLSTQVKNAVSCIHRPSRVFEQIANWPLPSIAINARPSTPILQAAPLDNKEWKMCPDRLTILSVIAIPAGCGFDELKKTEGGDTKTFSEPCVMRESIVPVYHQSALQGTTCQLYNLFFLPFHLQRRC